ncbi:MAG: flagellar protein FlgN [Candidatus Competibacteraceae bacterium]|nr:flagellar protein FlgN [Candidatus Competibacteraceae bacterium]
MTLAKLMRDELGALEGLREGLRREYDALKARDLGGLERAVADKQRCAERLRDLIAARSDALKQPGSEADAGDWAAYVEALPASERQEIDALWTALEQAAQQVRAQNEINGAVIAASRNHVERTLAILQGRDSLDFLYDQGSRKVFGGRNQTIAKA